MTRNKLLHVLGGGAWQVPGIQMAKRLGYDVLVTDMYPERPGYAFADHHEVVDISDPQATLAVATRYRIDGILCDTTDVGVPTAAFVAEKLGLPGMGYAVACDFTYKDRMRRKTAAAGIGTPPFVLVRHIAELGKALASVGLPLVIKPCDSQSSRGVTVVREKTGLEAAFHLALSNSHRKEVLVEAFIEGVEVTVEGIAWDGEPQVLGISEKVHYPDHPAIASQLFYPPDMPEKTIASIIQINNQVVRALGLRNGVTHGEYIVQEGRVMPVEIAARGGGSRIYSDIVPHLSGVEVSERMIQYSLNQPLEAPKPIPSKARAALLDFLSFKPGTVKSISGLKEASALPGVREILLEFKVGDVLHAIQDDRSRPGFVLVLGKSREDVLATAQHAKRLVQVETEG